MIRTVLVDDDSNSRNAAKSALSEYADISVAGEFDNSDELFKSLPIIKPDLAFLDIELNEETGFQIASRMHDEYPDVLFIFLTGHASYAIDGYGFHPVDFITKPIRREKLESALDEVRKILENRNDETDTEILFHLHNGYSLINTNDICYIERRDRKNYMITVNGELQISRYTMKELEDMLADHGFILCHQAIIVNLSKIKELSNIARQTYVLKIEHTDAEIPLSRTKYDDIVRYLSGKTKKKL